VHRLRPPAGLVVVGVVAVAVAMALVVAVPRLLGPDGAPPASDAEAVGFVPDPSGPARNGGLGEEAMDGDFSFVVSSLDCGAKEAAVGSGGARTAQGQYCMVAFEVRNVGRSPATFLARSQLLVDTADRRFAPDVLATLGHPGNAGRDLVQPVVNPGNRLAGVLVFDVPTDVRLRSVALRHLPAGPGATVWL